MSEIENVLDQYVDLMKAGKLTNAAPLLPAMFSIRGGPFSLKDHLMWEPLFNTQVPKRRTVVCGRQVGKTILSTSRVTTYNGEPKVATDIKVGDNLLCLNEQSSGWVSTSGKVTNVFDHYTKPMRRIVTRMGSELTVSKDHRLRTAEGYVRSEELNVGDRICTIRKGGVFENIPVDRKRLIITPYIIGDGCCTKMVRFTNSCIDVNNEIMALFPETKINLKPKTDLPCWELFFGKQHYGNTLHTWLKEDGLIGCRSNTKFIPSWVFRLSKADTITFISRLYATDGSIKPHVGNPSITYCSNSRKLIDGLQALLIKLGLPTTIRQKEFAKETHLTAYVIRIETREAQDWFLENIKVPGKPVPVELLKKKSSNNRATWPKPYVIALIEKHTQTTFNKKGESLRKYGLRKTLKYPPTAQKIQQFVEYFKAIGNLEAVEEFSQLLNTDVYWDTIKSIEEIGEQEAIDFEVEPHHNFVLAGGVVTHNSETSAVQMLTWQLLKDYTNILYVAPRDNQTKLFSNDKVAPYIKSSPAFRNRDARLPNGTYKRAISEGNNIHFSYAFLDAERIRSITAGAIFYDEAQDLNPSFKVLIEQCMAASLDFGVTQSTGTPKTFDNNLEIQWAESSQAEWCIPCHKCKKLNVPAVEFDLLGMIQPHGLACAKCGTLLNTREGWWEHRYPQRRLRHEGYHGPQVIFPMHCEKQPEESGPVGQKWQEILYQQESMPTYGFYNEILGTSYDNASELISKTALVENSTLDHDNSYKASVKLAHNRKKYTYITMGVDWGGGGESGVSRTAITILGWKSNAKPDVIYMDRILNPLPTDQEALFIKQMAQQFKVDLVADDYCGAGEAKEVILLQTGFPHEKLMPIAYVPSRVSKMMEYVPAEDKVSRPYIKVARTKSLTIMAALVNNGYYTFPKFEAWDAKEYPNNLLSLVQEKRDSTRGPASYFITHKANRADDLAHAINYASVGYWFVTKNTPDFSKLLGSEFVENGL